MNYKNITEFDKTPRSIKKEDVRSFLKNNGTTGKWIMILFLGSIALSVILFVLYFLSIIQISILVVFITISLLIYFSFRFLDPKLDKLNNYPLSMGYVLIANNGLYENLSETQGGSIMIFTKDNELKLDNKFITNIGEQIRNRELPKLNFLYRKIDSFASGKSFFSVDIPDLIDGVKIYCSYVILDTKNFPNGKIPKDRLIPCLVDENNRGIAVPYKLLR